MAQYAVVANILGAEDEGTEFVAGPFPTRGMANTVAQQLQKDNAPDPEDGDINYFVTRLFEEGN